MNNNIQTPLASAKSKAASVGLNFPKSMTTKKVGTDSYIVFYDGIECGIFAGLTASHAKAAYIMTLVVADNTNNVLAVSKALVVHADQNVKNEKAKIEAVKAANERAVTLKLNASKVERSKLTNTLKSEMMRCALKLIVSVKIKEEAQAQYTLMDQATQKEAEQAAEQATRKAAEQAAEQAQAQCKLDALQAAKDKKEALKNEKLRCLSAQNRKDRKARKIAHNKYLVSKQDRKAPNVSKQANVFIEVEVECMKIAEFNKADTILNVFDFESLFLKAMIIIPMFYLLFIIGIQLVGINAVFDKRACNTETQTQTGLLIVDSTCNESLGYKGVIYNQTNYKSNKQQALAIRLQKFIPDFLTLDFNGNKQQ